MQIQCKYKHQPKINQSEISEPRVGYLSAGIRERQLLANERSDRFSIYFRSSWKSEDNLNEVAAGQKH